VDRLKVLLDDELTLLVGVKRHVTTGLCDLLTAITAEVGGVTPIDVSLEIHHPEVVESVRIIRGIAPPTG
jgi:hypothetical protein